MFENLDDPATPTPAPVDGVVARGRQLRLHRRLIVTAAAMFVLAGTITTVAALQDGNGRKRVVVATPSSTDASTTIVPDTTLPASTTPTTDTTPSSSVAPVVVPSTATTTTPPPHDPNDLSMVTVDYGANAQYPTNPIVSIPDGQSKVMSYTVTNGGAWDVNLAECTNETIFLWSNPATEAWPPYSNGIWPVPYPTPNVPPRQCTPVTAVLPAGASTTLTVNLVAGYYDAAGNVMPAPPGFTSYQASFLPQCIQPCDPHQANSALATVDPPVWPPPPSLYSIVYKTRHLTVASGQSADEEITYTNGLAFTVKIPLFGPCWKVALGTATVDCSGPLPQLIIGPHESVDLHSTVWAREGFIATGVPLSKGLHRINIGDHMSETLGYTLAEATYLDVT